MKKLLMLLTLFVAFVASAQTESAESYKAYCEIVGTGNITGTKVKIEADLGQKRITDTWGGDAARKIVDENGKEIQFNSMMDAVNHFAQLGWVLEFTYAVYSDKGMSGQTVYHYVLSKTVSSDEEVRKGLNFKK